MLKRLFVGGLIIILTAAIDTRVNRASAWGDDDTIKSALTPMYNETSDDLNL